MTDPIIEAAARALFEVDETGVSEYGLKLAARVVAAVTPLIRAAALEEAAQIADRYGGVRTLGRVIATAIRALKEQP